MQQFTIMEGGGKEQCQCNQNNLCQMCEKEGHKASQCPWVYSHCSKGNCQGIMMMVTSEQEETDGQKFLMCQYKSCGAWKWLEDAIAEVELKKAHGTSDRASASSSNSCFHCGQSGHWVKNCLWKATVCPNGCEGVRKILMSTKEWSKGEKFLKCVKCGNFEWLKHAMEKDVRSNIRVKIEVNIDDLCNTYDKKMKFP